MSLSHASLNGLRVLNTRTSIQNQDLTHAITNAGGCSVELPALEIESVNDWLQNPPDLSHVQRAIFISANAVHSYFRALKQQQISWPANIDVIPIGSATAMALIHWGVPIKQLPTQADSEHLLHMATLQQPNQTILLVKGRGGRQLIEQTLSARGAKLIPVEVYQRVPPNHSVEMVQTILRKDAVDIILFFSQQGMQTIYKLFDEQAAKTWLCNKPWLVISERLADIAKELGAKTIIVSRFDHLLNSLCEYQKGLIHADKQ